MLELEQALEKILGSIPAARSERISVSEAYKRVVTEPITAAVDLPPFDNSSVDGYAVRAADAGPLDVIEEVPAGRVPSRALTPGTCTKIMTGAPVPAGADAVQQVEKTARDGNRVSLLAPVRPGQNIARRATDMREGEVVLRAGHRIRPADRRPAASCPAD